MRWLKTISLLVFTVLLQSGAIAADYDPLLLRTQASIFPKIILLDKDIEKKVVNNEVIITVIHNSTEKNLAAEMKSLIQEQYANALGKFSLKIVLSDSADFVSESTAYIVLNENPERHKLINEHAAKNGRISFSYNYKDFDNEALISLILKEKVYIYLNKQVLNDYGIKFSPVFYKIVKVVE